MDDMISRQAAIDVLNVGAELLRRLLDDTNIVGAERAKYEWELEMIESYISDMKELPSAESRWIPVTERLPDDGAEVWVTTDMLFGVTRARWHKDTNLWYHPYYSDCLLVLRPVAWMEISLPKPYKGGTK